MSWTFLIERYRVGRDRQDVGLDRRGLRGMKVSFLPPTLERCFLRLIMFSVR
jgi:hypothetical protein